MKATLIQMDIKWADVKANQQAAEQALLAAEQSDLYILPEMWSTGFATNPKDIAEEEATSSSLVWMQQMAQRLDAAVVGSLAIHTSDGTYRNRMYFVAPQPPKGESLRNDFIVINSANKTICKNSPFGGWGAYDKHHLFSYGHEDECYTAGKERVIVEWRGVRFLLQVCYDLRFPCFSRNKAPQPPQGESLNNVSSVRDSANKTIFQDSPCGGWGAYDAIIYVASWPTSRIRVWNTLLQARALENQCYVLGVNRIGEDPTCKYCGGTQCVDAYGRVVAVCEDNTPSSITVNLDMERLNAFRKKFPVLADAD